VEAALHLAELIAENFRLFGSREGGSHLEMTCSSGLTVLVGENDSGKTAVVDAIRAVLGTTAGDALRIHVEDFHLSTETNTRAEQLRIRCKFAFASTDEAAPFAEYLTIEEEKPVLYLTLDARRPVEGTETVGLRRGIVVDVRCGADGDGPRLDGIARSLLTATFLKPLRDAAAELASGRRSRLMQILSNFKGYEDEKVSDFDSESVEGDKVSVPQTLSGVLDLSQYAIAKNKLVVEAEKVINTELLIALSLATSPLHGTIGISESGDLRQILEKLELFLGSESERLSRGLGSNNVLFMAAELLLLRSSGEFGLPLLIIEEPEAHLHPQWQLTVIDYLQESCVLTAPFIQVILTTHSPTLASHVRLANLVLMSRGRPFSLAPAKTQLNESDYRFLERFLDATRANLFFARGVLVVEGDAENIVIPAIAEVLGIPLARYGVSIVNVGHRGLFRYARIFRRSSPPELEGISVACIADLDPKAGEGEQERADRSRRIRERVEGGVVRAFVAEQKTFEFDLAYSGLADYVYAAGRLAAAARDADLENVQQLERQARADYEREQAQQPRAEQATAAYAIVAANSKAVSAQYFANMVLRDWESGAMDVREFAERVPPYILDALLYVTGN
jgi:putative ATP-dependent endonuclease of OLD family